MMAGRENIFLSGKKIDTNWCNTFERVEVLSVEQIGLELARLQSLLALLPPHIPAGNTTIILKERAYNSSISPSMLYWPVPAVCDPAKMGA